MRLRHAEGFPGREQLGGLELELLHRDVVDMDASFGDDLPRARQPGGLPASRRTGGLRDRPASLWRRAADLVYAI